MVYVSGISNLSQHHLQSVAETEKSGVHISHIHFNDAKVTYDSPVSIRPRDMPIFLSSDAKTKTSVTHDTQLYQQFPPFQLWRAKIP